VSPGCPINSIEETLLLGVFLWFIFTPDCLSVLVEVGCRYSGDVLFPVRGDVFCFAISLPCVGSWNI
jgi:hypothetical protein